MKEVYTIQELCGALKRGRYPLRVKSEELVASIDRIRKPSTIVWGACLGSIMAVGMVYVGPQLALLSVFPGFGHAAIAIAAIGGGVGLSVLGLPTLLDAAKIWKGAGSDALSAIRSRRWNSNSAKEGVLS